MFSGRIGCAQRIHLSTAFKDVHRGFIFQQHLRNSVFVHSTALAVSFGSREKEG